MKRKYAQTLASLIVLGVLWGSFYFYGKRKVKETPASEPKQEKLLPLDTSQIQSFTLKPRDGQALTCSREGGQWTLVEPMKLPADPSAVSSLLSSLTSATVEGVVDPHPSDLKQFGLDPPAETLEVSTNTKPEKFELKLGDETPTGGGLYAQVGGNPRVVKLASYLKSSLEKKLFDLRDKRAVTLDLDPLTQIQVTSKKARYTLEKNPEGVWDLALPPPVRADRFTVEGLVSQLRNLSMRSVVAEDKSGAGNYGFSAPALTVELKSPAASQTLVLGRKEEKEGGGYYAMNSALAPVFTLDASLLTQLDKQPTDLREKDLFSFSTFDVRRLEVETAGGRRVIERRGDQWKQTAPAAKEEPRDKMDDLVGALRDLRAESFPTGVSLAAAGLAKATYRFQVEFGNKKEIVEASKVSGHVYARRSTDSQPGELSKTALDSIEKALNNLPQ